MQESPNPPTGPESPVTPATNLPTLRDPGLPTFPADPGRDAPLVRSGSARLFSRVILPLVLFVVMVGGIAFVTQYVPWRGGGRPVSTEKAELPVYVRFDQVVSQWNVTDSPALRGSLWLKAAQGQLTEAERVALVKLVPKQDGEKDPSEMTKDELKAEAGQGLSKYVKECETMQSGFYDFPFVNDQDREVEMGILDQSCTCSSVQVCLLNAQQFAAYMKVRAEKDDVPLPGVEWKALAKNEKEGIVLPPGAHGLTRVSWSPREQKQDRVVLTIQLWTHPSGAPGAPGKITVLQTAVRFVPPVMPSVAGLQFRPVEAKGSSDASFWCWTATRPEAKKLRVLAEKDDPCFSFAVTEADEKDRLDLQEKMWLDQHTLVKKAWRVRVTVHEERQGKQMDMGAFTRRLSLFLDDEKESHVGPTAKGMVSSDVRVGSGVGSGEGKIDVGLYDVNKGFKKEPFKVRTDPGVVLKFQESDPPFLKVELTPNKAESTKNRLVWNLRVLIPTRGEGNDYTGPLPDNSAIVLVRERADSPPRRIRILVEGTASVGR